MAANINQTQSQNYNHQPLNSIYPAVMNQIQINKQYIRQRVSQAQQPAFYQYFTQLHDVAQFNSWTYQRTIEVVNSFNQSRAKKEPRNGIETTKIQIIPIPQTFSNTLDTKKFQTSSSVFPKEPIKSATAKPTSALSLLQEIQQQMIFTPRIKNSKVADNKDNISKLQNSNASDNKTEQTSNNKAQLFKKFNNLGVEPIKSLQNQQSLQKSIVIEPRLNSSQYQQKFSLQRSVEFKRQKSDLKTSSDLKQKKSSNSDKVFKWKLNQQIPCRKLNGNLGVQKVLVSNHQMFHRYFLPDYVIYHILVLPSNLVCKRTYDQFLQLRSNLQKMFPCVKIPYIDSGSWFSQSDIALINRNKANLQLFLNELILHPTLSKANIIKDFLTIPDLKVMQSTLETYSSMPPIKNLSDLANDSGSIKIVLSEQNNKLIDQLPRWQKNFQTYIDKYTDIISNLTSQYQSIQLLFAQLVTLNYDFRMKITQVPQIRTVLGNFDEFQELLQRKQQYYGSKKKEVQKHIQNLRDKFSTTLKYEKLNVNSFQNLIQPIQKLIKRYIERLESQPQSPSSGLQTYKITVSTENFTSTIWDESENINLFKYQVGYLNCKLLQEVNIFNSKLVENLTKVWLQVFEDVQKREEDIIL